MEFLLAKLSPSQRIDLESSINDKFRDLFQNGLPYGIKDGNLYGTGIQVCPLFILKLIF